MKRFIVLSAVIITAGAFLGSCDKVENPIPENLFVDYDTTLYPGLYSEYLTTDYPSFTQNTNTLRNALIEDYTGHTCFNCPDAAVIAEAIHDADPDRVFVATIHAGSGTPNPNDFQAAYPTANKYYTNHRNEDGIVYGEFFANGYGFTGNPAGTVNRTPLGSQMFTLADQWNTRTQNVLADGNLKVNLQSEFNYYDATNGGFLHVEAEKLTSDAVDMSLVVYVIEDTLVDWQKMPDNSDNEFYVHKEKHLGSIDNRPWGQRVFSSSESVGSKIVFDYSYEIPAGLDNENMHLLIYAYDESTYEIYQVIKQKLHD